MRQNVTVLMRDKHHFDKSVKQLISTPKGIATIQIIGRMIKEKLMNGEIEHEQMNQILAPSLTKEEFSFKEDLEQIINEAD